MINTVVYTNRTVENNIRFLQCVSEKKHTTLFNYHKKVCRIKESHSAAYLRTKQKFKKYCVNHAMVRTQFELTEINSSASKDITH